LNGSFAANQTKYYGEFYSEDGSVLLFHFNNDSYVGEDEEHVFDWSGSGNNGTASNISFNSSGGKFFGAFEFNGNSDSYVRVNDSDTLDLPNEGSIELWIKPKELSKYRDVISKGVDGDYLTSPYTIRVENDGKISFYLTGVGGTFFVSSTDSLSLDTWHHVIVLWNLSSMELYINGVLNNSGVLIEGDIPLISNSYPLRIAETPGGGPSYSNFNGTVDELMVYNRALSSEEIALHYSRSLSNSTDQVWNLSSVSDGTYIWNCFAYAYNISSFYSNWSSTNYTFYVDLHTPPTINSITLNPNSSDDIDPDVMINVTANLTDVSGVDVVIFQYKRSGVSTWTNVTMNNISTYLWNASFTPITPPSTWNYRILSNDSLDHSGYSATYNLSAEYDYSWNRTPSDFGSVYIFSESTGSLGTLIINNTGDYPLNFDLSSTPGTIAIGYNITEPFDLGSKESVYINITATAPSTLYDYSVQIKINSTTSNANPASLTTNVTLISYIGGPYLDADIIAYSSTVQQSQNVNLSARLRNIGNETATGVWFNWTLPEGWLNTSGNLSYYVGNLSNGSTVWNNLTVNIDPATASQGITTIYVNATSNESINSSDFNVVGVECNNDDGVCGLGCAYTTDDDCSIPTTPGGGTSGSGVIMTAGAVAEPKYSIPMEIPIRLDVNRGETKAFYIYINNPEKNTTLDNITIFVAGYPQTLMSIKPKILHDVWYNQKKYFELNITAPVYFDYKEYILDISVKGEGVSVLIPEKNSTAVNTSRQVLLVVHKVIENATVEVLNKSESAIKEMEDLNFTTITVKKLLEQAKNDADKGNYERSKEQAEEILRLRDLAFKAYEALKQAEQSIQQAKSGDLKVSETEKMYSLALAAFQREDYKKAEERANSALLMYAIEAKFEFNFIKIIYEYWWVFSVIIIIFTPTIVILRKKFMLMSVKKEFENLGKEAKIINGLIENAQKKHFEDKIMSSEEYYKILYSYEKRLARIKRKRAEFVSKMVGLFKPTNTMEILQKEYSHIQDLIKDVQKKYFELGVMSKNAYQKNMEELIGEIAEIQKNMEMIKNAEKNG
jgi:hypothetical protein